MDGVKRVHLPYFPVQSRTRQNKPLARQSYAPTLISRIDSEVHSTPRFGSLKDASPHVGGLKHNCPKLIGIEGQGRRRGLLGVKARFGR